MPAVRLGRIALWCAIALLVLTTGLLLARNMLAIPALVPLDPNEGWNAAHTLRLLAGGPLYPPTAELMVNNYPPLSFLATAALTDVTGDAVIAGRLLAMASFLLLVAGVALLLRQMRCGWPAALLGAAFLGAGLLIASDYVGMDDPQMLGHAIQIAAFLILLRGRIVAAALLMAASLFVKHNLVVLPLALLGWQLLRGRNSAFVYLGTLLATGIAGLAVFQLVFGFGLLDQLASPRLTSMANLTAVAWQFFPWAALPLLALAAMPRGGRSRFVLCYAGIALAAALLLSRGDGVDINIYFDALIALSLGLGLVAQRKRRQALTLPAALSLLAWLALHYSDNGFSYTPAFAAQSQHDIAFLRAHPGPAVCAQLSLCLWAGKGATVDVFNIGEAIKARARDPAPLADMIAAHHFAVLQLDDVAELGPDIETAIRANYALDHTDDNGLFLVPKT